MAEEGAAVQVVPGSVAANRPETMRVVCPVGQGVTYGDNVSPLDEETTLDIDFSTAIRLIDMGFVRPA